MIRSLSILFLFAAVMYGCDTQSTINDANPLEAPSEANTGDEDAAAHLTSIMDAINAGLESDGAPYRVSMAEALLGPDEAGITVLQKDLGNKQLAFDFVPNDTRRAAWSGPADQAVDNITYAIDQTVDAVPVFGGLSAAETDAVIVRSHSTWEDLTCSELPQARNSDFGVDIGLVAFLNGLGGSPFVFADVQHAGFRDINFAGGILGVAFTFRFIDDAGNSTDIDNNGKLDAAFREIYYDPSWNWADDGSTNIDLESVATHEIGHGLSQAHFGNITLKNDGSLKASPRAVMNALYSGPYRDLAGTDEGGHCSNWGQWPQN